jgi:hypothetical protein
VTAYDSNTNTITITEINADTERRRSMTSKPRSTVLGQFNATITTGARSIVGGRRLDASAITA